MCHFGRCPAEGLQLEVRCCLHWVLCVFREVSLQGLCHCPAHGGLLDHGIPEEAFSGLMCVAVGRPAFVLLSGFRWGPAN